MHIQTRWNGIAPPKHLHNMLNSHNNNIFTGTQRDTQGHHHGKN